MYDQKGRWQAWPSGLLSKISVAQAYLYLFQSYTTWLLTYILGALLSANLAWADGAWWNIKIQVNLAQFHDQMGQLV